MYRPGISSDIMSRMAAFENTEEVAAAAIANTLSTIIEDRFEQTVDQDGRTIIDNTKTTMMMSTPPPGVQTDSEGLILPKKLINPCLESADRKQLHQELKWNNKIGKSVLNQKSELQKAYEKQREKQQQHQIHNDLSPTANLKGELSRVIMERAQKHELQQHALPNVDDDERQYVNPEYLNVRAKLRSGQRADIK